MCVDSKVLLTKSLKQAENLVNGSIGFVKEIMYAKNEIQPATSLCMLLLNLVIRTLTSLFQADAEKHGWVSIRPTITTWFMYDSNVYVEHSCTRIP